jgi:hypothetical protein
MRPQLHVEQEASDQIVRIALIATFELAQQSQSHRVEELFLFDSLEYGFRFLSTRVLILE